ncbi:MAG: hypothetical protein ABI571_05760 [Actinomycetota bacterium]
MTRELRGRMRLLRAAWLVVVPILLVMDVIGFVLALSRPELLRNPQIERIVDSLGIPVELLITVALLIPFLVGAALGCLVFLRRRHDAVAIRFSAAIILLVSFFPRSLVALRNEFPAFDLPVQIFWIGAVVSLGYVLLTFPTGSFDTRLSFLLFLSLLALLAIFPTTPEAFMDLVENRAPHGAIRLAVGAFSLFPAVAAGVQIHRYRRSGRVERQQMKWGVLPLYLFSGWVFSAIIIPGLFFELSGGWIGAALLISIPLNVLFSLGMARAILRYRLYDIDVVVNRALVYGLMTAIIAVTYLGIVVLLQGILGKFTQGSDLAVAGSTLAVAALFRPLRSRVQGFIDQRFYRSKYDAAETLRAFSSRLRDHVDLQSLSRELVDVVGITMQPQYASLWLRPRLP